jgi:hypothetical protein
MTEPEMSLGLYLQARKNLSHDEAIEFDNMIEAFKKDPYKLYKDVFIYTAIMVGLLVFLMVILPALYILALRLQ